MSMAYDEKDDYSSIKKKLMARKKAIYGGLGFLALVIIGITVGVATAGGSEANNKSGIEEAQNPSEGSNSSDAAKAEESSDSAAGAGSSSAADIASSIPLSSGSGSAGWSNITESTNGAAADSEEPKIAQESTGASKDALPYVAKEFNWKDASNWEWASKQAVNSAEIFNGKDIKVTSSVHAEPIRSKMGWGGEKIVLIEWERSGGSDTNIWMLNTKLKDQFADGNGWPYWGELDIFEMFTQDQKDKPFYDFQGQMGTSVAGYGQLTLHMGPAWPAPPCFCPASHTKAAWYQGSAPMTSGCTAQFANSEKNSIATVFGRDGNGQYLQLIQYPTLKKGAKKNGQDTWDILPGSGAVTQKIYNNANTFWGVPASDKCAGAGGHNPATGFPFFEDFRIVLEEQSKPNEGQFFKVTNIQIFSK